MTHHGEGLLRLTKDVNLVRQLKEDYRKSNVTEAEMAMLDYASKLTLEPWKMTEDDVLTLRDQAFGDEEVLHINMIAGYYAFVNRLADGLGLPLEDFMAAV